MDDFLRKLADETFQNDDPNQIRKGVTISWSFLSGFGNTGLARAVMFAPIIAHAVQINSNFISDQLGMDNVVWLYWSLIVIGFGQLLYMANAPQLIKQYGNNCDGYIIAAIEVMPQKNFFYLQMRHIRSFFRIGGGDIPGPSPKILIDEDALHQRLAEGMFHHRSEDEKRKIPGYIGELKDFNSVLSGSVFLYEWSHNFKILLDILAKDKALLLGTEIETRDTEQLRAFLWAQTENNDGKRHTFDWNFARENASRGKMRWLIFTLYAVGALYFIINTLNQILRMIGVSLTL